MSKGKLGLRRAAVPVLVLCFGAGAFLLFVKTRPRPAIEAVPERRYPVKVVHPKPVDGPVTVVGHGVVVPKRVVTLEPEVSGRVVFVDPGLLPGAVYRKGDLLVRLDDSDYQAALAQRVAALRQAQLELLLEQARAKVARRDWERVERRSKGPKDTSQRQAATMASGGEKPDPLVLREPYVQRAKAQVEAARAAVELARRNIQRTRITAPFDAIVLEKRVEVGALVGPQTPLVTLASTQAFLVKAAVRPEDLRWLEPLESQGDVVWRTEDGQPLSWPCRLRQVVAELDERGRMAYVLTEVQDPLGLGTGQDDGRRRPALLLNSYVEVRLRGRPASQAFSVPEQALREGGVLYVATTDDTLRKIEVETIRKGPEGAIVRGLTGHERVIVSRVLEGVSGMRLEVQSMDSGKD